MAKWEHKSFYIVLIVACNVSNPPRDLLRIKVITTYEKYSIVIAVVLLGQKAHMSKVRR